jgi:hypothetical protein
MIDSDSRPRVRRASAIGWAAMLAVAALVAAAAPQGAPPRFLADDPLQREPESQDATKVEEWDIDLAIDLATNLFGRPGDKADDVRARNVNTVDEVPDSSWFTNRIGSRPVSIEEAVRGPLEHPGPSPDGWTVIHSKDAGMSPGFTMRDGRGDIWFVSFDPCGYPEAVTGGVVVANKIFWALGYFQVENHLIAVHPDRLTIDPRTRFKPPSGTRRQMRRGDLDDVFKRAHRSPDGSYRAVAGRAIPGRVVGGFRYHGTRPDDPNDVVPHEHRRELRALKVFGAWTNLVDMKAGNTLDSVVPAGGGRSVVRHYLQDVGSTFGSSAIGARDYDEGWDYQYAGRPLLLRACLFGLPLPTWAGIRYDEVPGIGRFEAARFDPERWKPRAPTAAFLRARPDDTFWAARRVAAFSEAMIRAIAKTGAYSDPRAADALADVLIARRDKIARAYLPAVNPIVDVALSNDGTVTFANAAVDAGVSPAPSAYVAAWARFDNATGETTPIGAAVGGSPHGIAAPAALPATPGAYVTVRIRVADGPKAWTVPVQAYFRRDAGAWTLVGLERQP